MIATLGRVFSNRHKGRRGIPEEDPSLVYSQYVPSAKECLEMLARTDARRRIIHRLGKAIAEGETRLVKLRAKREALWQTNAVARALRVSGLIAKTSVEDDASILFKEYEPDQEEAKAMKARLDARGLHLVCINYALYTGQIGCALRTDLLSRADLLERSCAVGKHILSPMRNLPSEILGYIFTLAVPPLNLDPVLYDHIRRVPLYPDEPHPHEVRTRISQVCRKWRKITEETPRMWTTLALNFPLPRDISSVGRCLKNSKACQLDIFFTIPEWFQPEDESLVQNVLDLIRKECSRIRIFISQANTQEHLASLFSFQMDTQAPFMEICSVEQLNPNQPGIVLGGINAPRLETLVLLGACQSLYSFASTSFLHIRRLMIGGRRVEAPWELWLKILSTCPRLEALHIALRDLDPSGQWNSVTLPCLTKLVLRADNPMTFQQMLLSLHTPALVTFSIESWDGYPVISHVFEYLSDEVAASLKNVILRQVDLVGEGAAQAVRRLTHVETISTYASGVDQFFFNTLVPPVGGPDTWACPNLRELLLTGTSVSGDGLLRLIDRRTLPDTRTITDFGEPQHPCLSYVRVSNCINLENRHKRRLWQLEKTHAETLELITDGLGPY